MAPTELQKSADDRFYKYFVPTGRSAVALFKQDRVSSMQVTEKTGNDQLPLASAFCWKCCT